MTRSIRIAGAADLPALRTLYHQLNPSDPIVETGEAERILETFGRYPGSAIFLADVKAEAVATCALVVIPNLTRGGAPYGLVENVVTDATHRKQGHGRAVIEAALASAWEHGCYKVMLLTGSKRPETLRFYEGIGFEQNKTGFQIRRLPVREE